MNTIFGFLELIIFLPPSVNKEKHPRKRQHEIASELPRPIARQILQPPLEPHSPHRHRQMKSNAALGEKSLEFSVLHESRHEKKAPDHQQQQPRERVRDSNQQLIVRRRPQNQARRRGAVAENRDFFVAEHDQNPTSRGDRRVERAD